ncbi:MAG: hypothetical protein ABH814_00495 [bacterium]
MSEEKENTSPQDFPNVVEEVVENTAEVEETPVKKPFIALSKKQSLLFFGAAFIALAALGFYKGYAQNSLLKKKGELPPQPTSSATESSIPKTTAVLLPGKVLFTSNRDGDSAIYYSDLKGEQIEKFITNIPDKNDSGPIVSPDKKYIAFYSDRGGEKDSYGNPKSKLYLYNITAKSVKEVSGEAGLSGVRWLPDSSGFITILGRYVSSSVPYEYVIYLYKVGSGSLESLVKNSQFEPYEYNNNAYMGSAVVSGDSRRMAFTVNHSKNPAVQGVWIYNFFDGRSWRVSDKSASGTIEFSKDGQKVEFDSYTNNAKKRYMVDIDGGLEQEIPLIDKGEYCYQYDGMGGGGGGTVCARSDIFFSDGVKKAYVDTRDNKSDVYISNVDGSEETRLTTSGGVGTIVFGPEEKYIIYSYSKADDSAVFLLDLAKPLEPKRLTSTSSTFVEYLP